MNISFNRAVAAALLAAGLVSNGAWAQTAAPATKETGNTLTGGAEATTTDKGTPSGPAVGAGQQLAPPTSGSSATGNTLTGGAEGTTTDKGTPTGPAIGGGAAAPASVGAGPMPSPEPALTPPK